LKPRNYQLSYKPERDGLFCRKEYLDIEILDNIMANQKEIHKGIELAL
jgi:hypothetical protein